MANPTTPGLPPTAEESLAGFRAHSETARHDAKAGVFQTLEELLPLVADYDPSGDTHDNSEQLAMLLEAVKTARKALGRFASTCTIDHAFSKTLPKPEPDTDD